MVCTLRSMKFSVLLTNSKMVHMKVSRTIVSFEHKQWHFSFFCFELSSIWFCYGLTFTHLSPDGNQIQPKIGHTIFFSRIYSVIWFGMKLFRLFFPFRIYRCLYPHSRSHSQAQKHQLSVEREREHIHFPLTLAML